MTSQSDQGLTRDAARALVQKVQDAFRDADVETLVAGYTDDVVIRFADHPEIHGKHAAEDFLRARFARQKNYRLNKELRTLDGNMVGNYWEGVWEDAKTGRKMRGRGTEFWTLSGGKIAIWEAAFNVWAEGDNSSATPIV